MNQVTLTLTLIEADRILHALINERARVGGESLNGLLSTVDTAISAALSDAQSDDEPFDGFRTDAEADADALASAGHGTDEDYGGAEDAYLDSYWEDRNEEPCCYGE